MQPRSSTMPLLALAGVLSLAFQGQATLALRQKRPCIPCSRDITSSALGRWRWLLRADVLSVLCLGSVSRCIHRHRHPDSRYVNCLSPNRHWNQATACFRFCGVVNLEESPLLLAPPIQAAVPAAIALAIILMLHTNLQVS